MFAEEFLKFNLMKFTILIVIRCVWVLLLVPISLCHAFTYGLFESNMAAHGIRYGILFLLE